MNTLGNEAVLVKDKPPDYQSIMQIMRKEASQMAQMDKNQAMEALGGALVRLGEF